jgi:hypothetical protein
MSINVQSINPLKWGLTKLSEALATVTVDPFTDLISYVHPQFGAILNKHTEIKENENSPISHIMSPEAISALIVEVKTTLECGKVFGDTKIYTGIKAHYEGNGSLFGHALIIPLEQISKKIFSSTLKDEPLCSKEALQKTKYTFTDNETRFQISRAISHMKSYSHLKIIARILVVALAIFIFFIPAGWMGGFIIFGGASILYCSVNLYIEQRSDRRAIKILTKRFEQSGYTPLKATLEATKAATNCLKKIVLQNIDLRKDDRLCQLLLTKSGNFRFDLSSPSLTSRIKKLEKKLNRLTATFTKATKTHPIPIVTNVQQNQIVTAEVHREPLKLPIRSIGLRLPCADLIVEHTVSKKQKKCIHTKIISIPYANPRINPMNMPKNHRKTVAPPLEFGSNISRLVEESRILVAKKIFSRGSFQTRSLQAARK